MTAAAALLDRLKQLGVAAAIKGTGLRLRPASRVPFDLLAELRTHKPAVMALLTTAANNPVRLPRPLADAEEAEADPPAAAQAGTQPEPARGQTASLCDPDAEWVREMAEALMANTAHRITDRAKAMQYFRGRALAMLDATPDTYARGLLLGFERHRHVKAVHFKPTGR
jgi:hypothetical protein